MSDTPVSGETDSRERLAAVIAQTVLDTAGVIRLEPTLKNAISRLNARAAREAAARLNSVPSVDRGGQDGILLSLHQDGADVVIDIATDARYTALEIAEQVQGRIAHVLSESGVGRTQVKVSILAIEKAANALH
ncbi:hypothetical protein LWF01_00700 [Saxibacter everestensis]|uniref:Asp23/Gls24 family envelope stress response protein n=1 Tax=Saxibacter everestensis TaxID=2909229 RepID=A0ABY8QTI3_9MICO|nr:hypothetical protein LWF01_00700 [Brevibacteriaceae bacterium ZFBP1038]